MRLSAILFSFLFVSCSVLTPFREPASFDSKTCFALTQSLTSLTYPAQERRLAIFHKKSFDLNDYVLNHNGELPEELSYYSQAQKKATQLNISEMIGVKRGDGVPYATHPIKLSYLAESILGKDSAEAHETFLYTMIHDILEEGQGLNPQALQRLQKLFPESPNASEAAYILVEPDLSSLKFPEDVSDSMIEIIGYSRQITFFADAKNDRALLNASIIDKLFNLFDRFYAVKSGAVDEEDFDIKMKWRLAKQGFLLSKMENHAHPDIVTYARSFHNNLLQQLEADPKEVQEVMGQYEALDQTYGEAIDELILEKAHEFSVL